ncbi:carboxylesterase family protein [Pigmentiphaga soli]|uniref:Carboxylesterase family protein n=1 Tax=Pigmentiphaga soli TaxID=1007095 RepID=A0ABP8HAM3_9BURK
MQDQQTGAADLTVATRCGPIAGAMAGSGVRVFKGIPYAAPPVGALRWRAPRPPAPWRGVRPALEFGPDCPQSADVGSRSKTRSEDCLYLNVWAPAGAAPGSLPVMVWVHGGSFMFGSGAEARLDGTRLAAMGVVAVTINYRVGLFGYLAHPALSRESEHGVSGNYGLLDQIAAFGWIRDNIAAFGGDPSRVTAFGVSAGSASLSLLLASPLGGGLFQQTILESAGAGRRLASLADAEAAGTVLGTDIDALRALPADEVLAKTSLLSPKVRGLTLPRVLRPIRDGWLLPEDERPVFKQGRLHAMPTIVGSNVDEGSRFTSAWPIDTPEKYRDLLDANFPGMTGQAMAVYPPDAGGGVPARVGEIFADTQFNYGTRLLARSMAAAGQPTWRYLFARRRPKQTTGPHHVQEVPYVFGNLDDIRPDDDPEYDATDMAVSKAIMDAWVAFARTGNPNAPGLARWPAYDAAADCYLEFGNTPAARAGWRTQALDFLDAYYDSLGA